MKRLLLDSTTKDVVGYAEAENFDNWAGEHILFECDNIDDVLKDPLGYYVSEEGNLLFSEEKKAQYGHSD